MAFYHLNLIQEVPVLYHPRVITNILSLVTSSNWLAFLAAYLSNFLTTLIEEFFKFWMKLKPLVAFDLREETSDSSNCQLNSMTQV